MGRSNQYTAAQFIEAIKGSRGIVSTIARRVGCHWNTADKYINEYPTVRAAYDAEKEALLDLSESVVARNIEIAQQIQDNEGEMVDTADAKWYLTMKGKGRGYIKSQHLEHTGEDGGEIVVKISGVDNV